MFDFLQNLRKSEAEKRQEAITAYLDDALTAGERQRLEQQMAADPDLQADMEQQQLVKLNISRLPKVRAPRNFTLNPALYGRPARQSSARLYPAMRVATVLIGVFFIIAVGAEILTYGGRASETSVADQIVRLAPAPDVEMAAEAEMALEEAAPVEEPRTGFDSDVAVPASGEAAPIMPEEEQPQEAPAESLGAATDEDLAEAEEAVEESLADVVVTAEAEVTAENNAAEEAAPLAPEEEGEADALPPAEADDGQADLPSGGGAEPADAPRPGVLLTEVAGRTTSTATENAIGVPTLTSPADDESDQELAASPEELVAQTPGEAVAEPPEPLPLAAEPAERQAIGGDPTTLQVVILLLGIALILLAAVTLITRRQQKN